MGRHWMISFIFVAFVFCLFVFTSAARADEVEDCISDCSLQYEECIQNCGEDKYCSEECAQNKEDCQGACQSS